MRRFVLLSTVATFLALGCTSETESAGTQDTVDPPEDTQAEDPGGSDDVSDNDVGSTGSDDGSQDTGAEDVIEDIGGTGEDAGGGEDTSGGEDVIEDTGGTGEDTTGELCCETDVNCADGEVCVPEAQVCRSITELEAGECWTLGQCDDGATCQGVILCPCGQECPSVSEVVGTCEGGGDKCADFVPPGCVQAGCPADKVCDTKTGDCISSECSCDPATGVVSCTDDCEGGVCVDPTTTGDCCPDGPSDCGPAMVCVKGPMTCKSKEELDKGQCWSIENCPTGMNCVGANVCPCAADCALPDNPGKCISKPVGGCKVVDPTSFGDCEALLGVGFDGKACVAISGCDCGDSCDAIFDTIVECEKACIKDPCADFEEPGCLASGCPGGKVCDPTVGCVPSECSCDKETGDVICTEDCGGGTCVPKPGSEECCEIDKDCGVGMFCVEGVCKKNAAPYCWVDAQCKSGGCHMAQVCPCGMTCDVPDKPGKCTGGVPVPIGGPCKAIKPDGFGACDMELGWAWTGTKCELLSGCDCEPMCDQIYKTLIECTKACSKLLPAPG